MKKNILITILMLLLFFLTFQNTFAIQDKSKLVDYEGKINIIEINKQNDRIDIMVDLGEKSKNDISGNMFLVDFGPYDTIKDKMNKVYDSAEVQSNFKIIQRVNFNISYTPSGNNIKYKELSKTHKLYYFFKQGLKRAIGSNGEHYITVCGERPMTSHYTNMICNTNQGISLYYYNGKEYKKDDYYKTIGEQIKKEEESDENFVKRFDKVFNEYKMKVSPFGKKTKYKTTDDLKNYLKDNYMKGISKTKNIFSFRKLYSQDANNRVSSLREKDYERYGNIILGKWIKEREEKIKEEKDKKESFQKEAISNYGNLQKEIDNQNESRKKAIIFSKKLLDLMKGKTKQGKLIYIKKIKEMLNTKYGPENFQNQTLISYVKDYLEIVEYAVILTN